MQPDPATPVAASTSVPAFQFTIRDLALLTLVSSGALLVARTWGPGTLVLSSGQILLWLNARGKLSALQQGRAQIAACVIAWVLFAASLCLPVFPSDGGEVFLGWKAAEFAGRVLVGMLFGGSPTQMTIANRVLYAGFNLANLLMCLSAGYLYLLRRNRGGWYATILAVAAVTAWRVPFGGEGWGTDWREGCYLWGLSFMPLLAARRTGYGTLAAATAMALAVVWWTLD